MPEGFRFGVATAGFQIEGGFNGPGEPRNNWHEWEALGRVEPSGIALDFWNRYPQHLDRAASLGIDSFRLSVEWARCEPAEGEIDEFAFERYGAILEGCRERGLEPLVTLLHFTHPAWLGVDFWDRSESPERFAAWAALAAERLGERCTSFVTLNEINVLPLMSYFLGAFPPGGRFDVPTTLRVADHLLSGHVLAYDAVKRARPEANVSTNNFNFSVYELDRMLVDLLSARSYGVERGSLGDWLRARRAEWYASSAAMGAEPPGPGHARRWPRLEEGLRRVSARLDPLKAFPRTVEAVFASAHDRTLDVVQIDYYVPETAGHFQLPGARTAGGRLLLPQRPLWDDPPSPEGLTEYCAGNVQEGLEVWIVENGLANRVRNGRSYPRLDGWDRVGYLKANLGAVVAAIDRGVPVTGYWHWCLADNYEWGSYEPRFGLFGVDRERGVRWSDLDSMGGDAAGTYRAIIAGLRAGDRSVVS